VDADQNGEIERVLWEHPVDALFLLGDAHLHWFLARWERLPPHIRRHLPERDALETALSKHRSMQLAAALDVPVLETERCTSPEAVQASSRRLAPRGRVVVKGESGSGGETIRGLRTGQALPARDWRAVTRGSPYVMVQRRLRGARMLVTVAYEHGEERAACAHEKVVAWPFDFGPAAVGVTRRVEAVHDYTDRMFRALRWHGMADIEFRQDVEDGRWYFMEINPRVPATLGIQARAGNDVVAAWADVCEGRGSEAAPGRVYREGVRYGWSSNLLALAMRRPWSVPHWAWTSLAAGETDLQNLDPGLRTRALRLALWLARHPHR
jgi:hypothetical protein